MKPLKQNALPLPSKTPQNRQEWELQTFDEAVYFTVSRRTGPSQFATALFQSLHEAMRDCMIVAGNKVSRDPTAMLYAVTAAGRSFCLPPKEWLAYLSRWKDKQ